MSDQHMAREDFIAIISRVTSLWAKEEPNQIMEDEDLACTATDLLDIVGAAVGLYQAACPDDCCHMGHWKRVDNIKEKEKERDHASDS